MNKLLIFAILSFLPAFIVAQNKDTLFIYGPGGPLKPIEECGIIFSKKAGIPLKVIAGPEAKWVDDAKKNADLVFGGAEYMLTQFKMQHPGLMDSTTRTELYKRGAGILVRPGNPKKIYSLKDLTRPGVNLLEITGAGQLGMW